jgi:hypothetical protein
MQRDVGIWLEALAHGQHALRSALEKARKLEQQGDVNGALHWREKAVALQEYFVAEETELKRKASINPTNVRLYAAVSGLKVDKCIEISKGLRLDPTYAHVMAPFILAFLPAEVGKPHPGPWKSASGGLAIDVHTQATLDEGENIGAFDRLNSVWFLATLLRLRISNTIRIPVISDTSFTAVTGGAEPVLWPVEFSQSSHIVPSYISHDPKEGFSWVSKHIEQGADLMRNEGFSLAMQSNDRACYAESLGTAMVLLWSSVEALFRPGGRDITKTLSRMIATYLTDDPRVRDRIYQEIKALYEVRGAMIHAARIPDRVSVEKTANFVRQSLIRAIEEGHPPEGQRLLTAWSSRKLY